MSVQCSSGSPVRWRDLYSLATDLDSIQGSLGIPVDQLMPLKTRTPLFRRENFDLRNVYVTYTATDAKKANVRTVNFTQRLDSSSQAYLNSSSNPEFKYAHDYGRRLHFIGANPGSVTALNTPCFCCSTFQVVRNIDQDSSTFYSFGQTVTSLESSCHTTPDPSNVFSLINHEIIDRFHWSNYLLRENDEIDLGYNCRIEVNEDGSEISIITPRCQGDSAFPAVSIDYNFVFDTTLWRYLIDSVTIGFQGYFGWNIHKSDFSDILSQIQRLLNLSCGASKDTFYDFNLSRYLDEDVYIFEGCIVRWNDLLYNVIDKPGLPGKDLPGCLGVDVDSTPWYRGLTISLPEEEPIFRDTPCGEEVTECGGTKIYCNTLQLLDSLTQKLRALKKREANGGCNCDYCGTFEFEFSNCNNCMDLSADLYINDVFVQNITLDIERDEDTAFCRNEVVTVTVNPQDYIEIDSSHRRSCNLDLELRPVYDDEDYNWNYWRRYWRSLHLKVTRNSDDTVVYCGNPYVREYYTYYAWWGNDYTRWRFSLCDLCSDYAHEFLEEDRCCEPSSEPGGGGGGSSEGGGGSSEGGGGSSEGGGGSSEGGGGGGPGNGGGGGGSGDSDSDEELLASFTCESEETHGYDTWGGGFLGFVCEDSPPCRPNTRYNYETVDGYRYYYFSDMNHTNIITLHQVSGPIPGEGWWGCIECSLTIEDQPSTNIDSYTGCDGYANNDCAYYTPPNFPVVTENCVSIDPSAEMSCDNTCSPTRRFYSGSWTRTETWTNPPIITTETWTTSIVLSDPIPGAGVISTVSGNSCCTYYIHLGTLLNPEDPCSDRCGDEYRMQTSTINYNATGLDKDKEYTIVIIAEKASTCDPFDVPVMEEYTAGTVSNVSSTSGSFSLPVEFNYSICVHSVVLRS